MSFEFALSRISNSSLSISTGLNSSMKTSNENVLLVEEYSVENVFVFDSAFKILFIPVIQENLIMLIFPEYETQVSSSLQVWLLAWRTQSKTLLSSTSVRLESSPTRYLHQKPDSSKCLELAKKFPSSPISNSCFCITPPQFPISSSQSKVWSYERPSGWTGFGFSLAAEAWQSEVSRMWYLLW